MTTVIASLNVSHDLKAALTDIVADLAALAGRNIAEVTATTLYTTAAAAVADLSAFLTAHNVLGAKLNADTGVTDVNYAVNLTKTAVNPTAATLVAVNTVATAIVADLATFLAAFNALSTKLNSDAGVTDANYATNLAKTAVNPTAIAADTINTTLSAVVTDLGTFRTAFNTRQTKLNSDATVTGTDYAALAAVTAANPTVQAAVTLNTSAA